MRMSYNCRKKVRQKSLHQERGDTMEHINPRMMTIREVARTGILPEHALRILLKAGKLPAVYIGKKALINYDVLCQQLRDLGKDGLS